MNKRGPPGATYRFGDRADETSMCLSNGWSVSVVVRQGAGRIVTRNYIAAMENGAAALRAVKALVNDPRACVTRRTGAA